MGWKKRKYYALGRLKAGEKNQTEKRYEDEVLKPMLASGEILWYDFESITFKLADGCRYTPDFPVMLANMEMQFHEVKGSLTFIQDDAKVKIKVAAKKFPFRFILTAPKKRVDGPGWDRKIVGNGETEDVTDGGSED